MKGKKDAAPKESFFDLKYLIVETDEDNPKQIVKIQPNAKDEVVEVADGYRVRIKF